MPKLTHKRICVLLAISTVVGLSPTGCFVDQPTVRHFTLRRVSAPNRKAVMRAAEDALHAEGFRVDSRDDNEGVMTTEPMWTEFQAESSFTLSNTLSGGSPRRKPTRLIAQVRVLSDGDGYNAYCKVSVEQATQESHRMTYGDQSRSDLPGDQDVSGTGTRPEQNVLWTTVRRDRHMEQRILDAIASMTIGTGITSDF